MSRKLLLVDSRAVLRPVTSGEDASAPATLAARLLPGCLAAIARFVRSGYEVVILAPTAAVPAAPEAAFGRALFASQQIPLLDWRWCRHTAAEACDCGLPGLGLVTDLIAPLSKADSLVVGLDGSATRFAGYLGIPARLIGTPTGDAPENRWQDWEALTRATLDRPRTASVSRDTRETRITVTIDLDATAEPSCHTGLGFFDHMLEQLGKHGGFALSIECAGDLHVDEHHTIEDVALAFGAALKAALGDKRGIQRYGFVLPMDEAQAQIAIDLGGRPYLVFEGAFPRSEVGGFPTELVEHFFRSVSDTLGASVQVRVQGENTHHMIEACFKGFARALRIAKTREGDELPSTKGIL